MAEADDEESGSTVSADSTTVPIGTTQAPPETVAPPPGPDFTSMVKAPGDMAALQGRLAEIQRAKSAATASVADETMRRLEGDRARMEQAYKVSATMPEELNRTWDAKAKTAEHSTDPVTAFGSVGSVFAMLASSFAGLPMEHALNAGAAAINAVHQGDLNAYNRDYDAWQKNTNLAIKRHEIQHQAYTDATNLMNSNINAGRTKMELAATKFGDQKAQALLDAGMDKELFELINSRNKAALEMQSEWDKVQLQHEKVQDYRQRMEAAGPDQTAQSAARQAWMRDWSPSGTQQLRYDFVKDYIEAQKKNKPDWTPEDLIQWGKEATEAQDSSTTKGGANTDLTEDRQRAAFIAKVRDEKVAGGMPLEQAVQEARVAADKAYPPKMTAAQRGKYEDRIFMADQTLQTIDKQLERLRNYVGVSGAAGYLTRAGEKVSNVFGSNEVARQEFAKDTELMRLNASRMLTLSQGRPLAAEAARINAIIKGTSFGDLNAPTIAAMEDYKKFIEDFRRDAATRVGGPNPEGVGLPPASSSGSSKPKAPWEKDPVVRPKAEAESDVAYG